MSKKGFQWRMLLTCAHQAAAGSCTRLMLTTLTRVIAATNAAGQGTSSERRKVLKICAQHIGRKSGDASGAGRALMPQAVSP